MSVQKRIFDVTDYENFNNPYQAAQPVGNLFATSQYWNSSTPSTDTGDKIGYLEGYARGYSLKSEVKAEVPYHVLPQEFNLYVTPKNFVQAASLMNLPEFATQLYRDAVSGNFSNSAYMMLNSFPFNPPAMAGTNMTELSPAYLFKNSAGVYSFPYPYILWLGGIWKNWQVLPSVTNWNTELFLTFDGSRFRNILHTPTLIMNNPDYLLDYTTNDEGNIVAVDPAKLVYSTYYGDKFITIGGGLYSGKPANSNTVKLIAPKLNGLGIHYDMLKALFPYFNNGNALPDPLYKQFIYTFEQQNLRLFTSYLWMDETARQATLPAYAMYGIGDYSVAIEPTLDFTQDAFTVYSACWNWVYYHFMDTVNAGTDATTAMKDVITQLESKLSAGTVNTIVNALFVERKQEKSIVYNKASDRQFTLSLTSTITPTEFLMDFISKEILQMYDNIAANTSDTINDDFLIDTNAHFWATLYPSAGGVFGLQYLLEDTENFNPKSRLWAYAWENAILNSCRTLWYTGPTSNLFFNETPTENTDDPNEIRKYDLIGALGDNGVYYSTLEKLDNLLLFNKYEFDGSKKTVVPKELRTYVLPSAINDSQRNNYAPILTTDFIDYLGTGLLDFCQSEFNQAITNSTLKNLLLSLMVVDEFDFADTIKVQNVEFSRADQIDIITKYHQLFDNAYVVRDRKANSKTNKFQYVNYCVVMNTALTVAQYNKAVKVVKKILADRRLVNVPSVFDYTVSNTVNEPVKNSVARRAVVDPTGLDLNGNRGIQQSADNIRAILFGIQGIPSYSPRDDTRYNIAKYITRDYTTAGSVTEDAAMDYFYQTLNVEPNVDVIRVSKEYAQYYLAQLQKYKNSGYSTDSTTLYTKAFEEVVTLMTKEFSTASAYIGDYLQSVNDLLDSTVQASIQNAIDDAKAAGTTDEGLMKTKTYYNVKSLFDNWVQMGFNGLDGDGKANINLFFNYNTVLSPQNAVILNQANDKTTLFDQTMFVDRAFRQDVGQNLLVNIDWLQTFFLNNYGYNNINTNISIYSFMSALAQQHGLLLHTLPSFIQLDTLKDQEGEAYAGDLFNAYDFIASIETKPKFIFQFIGNIHSELDTPDNVNKETQAKSFSLSRCDHVPTDFQHPDASGIAFVVDFGSPTQQMFSNLQLDQSEFQNTEEYYKLITSVAKDKSQVQSSDLFSIYTARSYTAQIDTLGNMMIQPLMYFDLVNIPLFGGTYWITNVKHSIAPNDIKTTFKGVRQPMSNLPSRQDVVLQLARMNAKNLLGIEEIGELPTPTTPDGGGGGGNLPASISETAFDQVLANNVSKIVLLNNSTLFENDLYQHFVKYNYMNQGVPYAALKMILALESGGDTKAVNKSVDKKTKKVTLNGAAGIIQWMPDTTKGLLRVINNNSILLQTANSLGIKTNTKVFDVTTNVNFITGMTLEQQIFFAKVFFADQKGNVSANTLDGIWQRRSHANPFSSGLNMYAAVFYPPALKHWNDDSYLICSLSTNKGCVTLNKWYSNDPNNPQYITVGTFKKGAMSSINRKFHLV